MGGGTVGGEIEATASAEDTALARVWTVPNMITGLRIALIPIFAWLFSTGSHDLVAFVLAVVIGSTDWVDGFVARRLRQVSRLGKLLDPVADRLAIVVLLLALVFRGTVPLLLAAVILLRDLVVSVTFPVLEARGYPRLPVNRVGKLATALIFGGMGFAVASLAFGTNLEEFSMRTSTLLLAAGAVLYWVALAMYARELRRVMRTMAST
jgi:cardiolipin synthase (CMP-forming)